MSKIEEYQSTIKEQLTFFQRKGEELQENTLRWKPSEDEWSIMEVLCHVKEFPLYFTHELLLVVKENQQNWGRGLKHEERLAAVEAADQENLQNVLQEIKATQDTVIQRLGQLNDDDLKIVRAHRNPKFGDKPMSFLVDHFLIEHVETHQKQVERVLKQYSDHIL
ncbi:DinB family protein [Salibacterium aidingense]|uniref:DinB family protein n=1 Tax=Salibacterium aidingense TaxID=384933 RepID=UPI003BD63E1D